MALPPPSLASFVLVLAVGCATAGVPPRPVAPTGSTATAPTAPPPPVATRRPPADLVVRYGPSSVRYLVSRHLHVEQSFGGQQQVNDLEARIYLRLTIAGPADAAGYPTTFTVDSIVPDSNAPGPVAIGLGKVRGLVVAGRLAPRGDFQGSAFSDTASAQVLSQLMGNFRDFLPHLPPDGVRLGQTWTDTLTATQRGGSGGSGGAGSGNGEVTRRTVLRASASGWEDRAGVRSLRIETSQSYTLAGAGQNAGQAFEVKGAGIVTGRAFLAEDGRFMGGESRDSTSITISLPEQGLTIPVVQLLTSAATVRP